MLLVLLHLLYLSILDIKYRKVSNLQVLLFIINCFMYSWIWLGFNWLFLFVLFLLGFIIGFFLYALGFWGGADGKLFIAIFLLLGFNSYAWFLFWLVLCTYWLLNVFWHNNWNVKGLPLFPSFWLALLVIEIFI